MLCALLCVGVVQTQFCVDAIKSRDIEKFTAGTPIEAHDAFTSLYESVIAACLVSQNMEHAVEVSLETQVTPQTSGGDSLNVIYVIGESYIKRHSRLYGYSLPTTPNLDAEKRRGNLFVFDDVVSFSSGTSEVMKNTLCCNSLRYDEKWYDTPYFPTLFKKAGYDVFLWDNQREFGGQALFLFSIMAFMYDEGLSKVSYTKLNEHPFPFDGQLVEDFSAKSNRRNARQLVMFHLMGQHMNFKDRYPHEKPFEAYTAKDIKLNKPYLNDDKRQLIAEYDNATFYNDYVLKKIIDLYRDKNTVVLYFSDHGEEVYDYRDSWSRVKFDPVTQPEGIHCQYDVPFMIWCSDEYMRRNPDIVKNIRQSLHKPFRTDEICQVLFHLANLKTSYYRPKCDLLSPHYVKYARTVGDGIKYD